MATTCSNFSDSTLIYQTSVLQIIQCILIRADNSQKNFSPCVVKLEVIQYVHVCITEAIVIKLLHYNNIQSIESGWSDDCRFETANYNPSFLTIEIPYNNSVTV